MADFDKAIDIILEHEGKFSDNKNDRGGPTNFGISLRFLKSLGLKEGDLNLDGVIDINDIKMLTQEKSEDLYEKHFWDENRFGEINDQRVATKIFDIAVNCGAGTAGKLLQRAINDVYMDIYLVPDYVLKEDGNIGEKTLSRLNTIIKDNFITEEDLLERVTMFQKEYYRAVLKARPEQKENINGWINRANDI